MLVNFVTFYCFYSYKIIEELFIINVNFLKTMDEKIKKQIDEMDYESMLSLWRHARAGHPMFQGETGDYYSKVMRDKSAKISDSERVTTSKSVGW